MRPWCYMQRRPVVPFFQNRGAILCMHQKVAIVPMA